MIWIFCFLASFLMLIAAVLLSSAVGRSEFKKKKYFNLFNCLFAGVFLAAFFVFIPIHNVSNDGTFWGELQCLILSVFNSMQIFTIGTEFSIISDSIEFCPDFIRSVYQAWAAAIYVLAPIFTFGFVLSLFKNMSAYVKYLSIFFKDVYVFSELNEKSFVLAEDLKNKKENAAIVFTDVFEDNEEKNYEIIEKAKSIGAICFKKDILLVAFKNHSKKKNLFFFTIGENETENLNQSLKIIESYKLRKNTHLYVFSTSVESELLLTAVDKGEIKVRRINEVQSLVNRVLYESGSALFENAIEDDNGIKHISAIVVGMGCHGTEMVKALSWFCQMDGYKIEINAFDKDDLAEEKFVALAPELMSPSYNGIEIDGEAQYKITIHSGLNVETSSFAEAISRLKNATYVMVALGDDDINIKTAVMLRMLFERIGIHPEIQAIVYNSQQKKALSGIKNFRGQAYNIKFIGDLNSSFTENVIIDSDLEEAALKRHLKWGDEDSFWTYEYNYRSSIASAIHMQARIKCGIHGAAKKEDELTDNERMIIEALEHRRWNAYMRAEGYIFSGSKDKESRNDLAKMHHDLVDYSSLSDEEKRKDSRIGAE